MFYCEECRKKNEWPESLAESYGSCECCKKTGMCHDLNSRLLPAKEVSSKHQHLNSIHSRVEHLGCGGLCDGDQDAILEMTLSDIADEFRLPEWLLVRAVETLTMASTEGRKKERVDRERDEARD